MRPPLPQHEWTPVPTLGVSVHARAWDGPAAATPIVLVAGLGASSRYWVRLGRRLAGERAVVAPDLPGFGRTPALPGSRWPAGPDVREQADQLLAWMDARGIGRAVLVGHSVGCQTVVDVAVRFPGRAERVVLAAPPFEPGRRTLAVSLSRLAMGAWVEVPSLPPLLGLDYAATGVARALQQARRTMHYPMERVLPGLSVPTLVVHGRLETLVSRRWVETVASLVRQGTLVVVERAGHAMHYSAATVTAEVIRRFVRGELDGPAAAGVVAPPDAPRADPLGPTQPISSQVFGRVSGGLAVAAVALPVGAWGRAVVAGVGLLGGRRRVPMVIRATATAACGLGLIVAAARGRRRWGTAAYGACQLAVALLAEKPTGPARHRLP